MKPLLFFTATLCSATLPLAAKDKYCFENAGLKSKDTIRFTVEANRINGGSYTSADYDDETKVRAARFTGTKTGTVLTIQFKGKPPYAAPKGSDPIMWRLDKKGLHIPMHGKNHQTGKYSDYEAPFQKCQP